MRVRAPWARLAVRLKSRNPKGGAPQRRPTASIDTPARLAMRLQSRNLDEGVPTEVPAANTNTSSSPRRAAEEPHYRRRCSWGDACCEYEYLHLGLVSLYS